ncbi:MAG: thioredoxin family protein [Candidatus Thorarchaeota archaeon]
MVIEMDEETRKQVEERFQTLDGKVSMHLFVESQDCLYCSDAKELASKIAELSEKIELTEHDLPEANDVASEMGIRFTPAIVLHGKEEYNLRFYGIPAGHEFGALISDIVDVSTESVQLPEEMIADIEAINQKVHIQVFTTPQCPYCPNVVRLAHQAAIINLKIESDMIEALEFKDLAQRYEVFGVPKTIFNEVLSAEGNITPEEFVDKLYEATET